MPRLLEAALLCENMKVSPRELGFDSRPSILRDMRWAMMVYQTALDYQDVKRSPKKRHEWEKAHPEGVKLLKRARTETEHLHDARQLAPNEVRMDLPERPHRGK